MTKAPTILVASIAISSSSPVIIAAFNVFHRQVVAPVFLRSIYVSKIQFQSHLLPSTPSKAAAVNAEALIGDYFSIYQHSTGRLQASATLPTTCALALSPISCDTLAVVKMTAIKSTDRSAVLHTSCIGEPSRYAGAAILMHNIYSVLTLPDSNTIGGSDSLILCHRQRQ
ncbi:hypothetical protein COEREDRAFT_86778 [Coemansia reversa NRRL 1564]|uniref:Uncharacterized protein n=1 Tax=Coemansia reversa (strain ATCC 12441 / NRRL 1564) TaxID=763665 RepID=A0A2G5BCE7_COERN|nr:hypothetical protein COEREDRAFT_86778 [Coemansia reversa NRRL 1564]|eukprot:PIA16694.1 hypothetical protein COEREDRAFT_86778 [Coemansia reversa NRRL 1564]